MSLAKMLALAALEEGLSGPTEQRRSPQQLCKALRELAQRYVQPNQFQPGDLITPSADSDMKGKGQPHIVLEVRERPAPDFGNAKSADDAVSNAYGRRCDIRTASAHGGNIAPFWVESWQFEPYRGPGAEASAA